MGSRAHDGHARFPLAAASLATLPAPLVLVGAGKMGGALLRGWLAGSPTGGLDPAAAVVIEPHPSPEIADLCAARGLRLNPDRPEPAGVLVLGFKPQGLDTAAPSLAPWIGEGTLVVSILAGKTISDLKRRLPGARAVVRRCRTSPPASAAAPPARWPAPRSMRASARRPTRCSPAPGSSRGSTTRD